MMACKTNYVTEERQEEILRVNGKKLLKKLKLNATFMASLVRDEIIGDDDARDIQKLERETKQRQELIDHLKQCKVEDFVSFCIVLHDEGKRDDIVCDDFGLDIDSLKLQKEGLVEVRREREEKEKRKKELSVKKKIPQAAGRSTGVNIGMDEVDSTIQDMLSSAPDVPRYLSPEREPAASMLAQGIEEVEMINDPDEENEVESNALTGDYQWMGSEFERLRKSLEGEAVKPVVIALLDSGVLEKHPDLKGMFIDRKNFVVNNGKDQNDVEDKDLTSDKFNHGTMSAGIVGQYAGERNVAILNLKVVGSNGKGQLDNITKALEHIKEWDKENPEQTVEIVLMTLGSTKRNAQTDRLLSELGENKIFICSAANDGQTKPNCIRSPANHGSVIAIGSCNKDGDRCSHSAVGQELDFLFPGEDIWSTSSKCNFFQGSPSYKMKTGTSFAAPHCAALVALILTCVGIQGRQQQGMRYRKFFTNSLRMKELIQKEFGEGSHSKERGFGIPQVDRVTVMRILAFVEQHLG